MLTMTSMRSSVVSLCEGRDLSASSLLERIKYSVSWRLLALTFRFQGCSYGPAKRSSISGSFFCVTNPQSDSRRREEKPDWMLGVHIISSHYSVHEHTLGLIVDR